MELFLVLKIDF